MSVNFAELAHALWAELDISVNPPGVIDHTQAVPIIEKWLQVHFGNVGPALREYHQQWSEALDSTARRQVALMTIRDLPCVEQDNMISANMRRIATDALRDDGG